MKVLLAIVLVAACGSPRPAPAPPSRSQTGEREHGMLNCPSAVASARTTVVATERGVDLVITAEAQVARDEIVRLAERAATMNGGEGVAEHSGMHGGPGTQGYCPIVHQGTAVTYTATPEGAIIHVQALAAEDVAAVQSEARARAARFEKPTAP